MGNEENVQKQPGAAGPGARVSVKDLKKGGRPTDAEIIAKYEKEKLERDTSMPKIVLQPSHVEGLVQLPYRFIANVSKRPEWQLNDADTQFLAGPFADVLNELLPELFRRYPKYAVLAIAIISITTKKAMEVSRAKKEVREEESSKSNVIKIPEGGMTKVEAALRERSENADRRKI